MNGLAHEFDYIVVGSGAGGGPVAANLAEAGYHVLLLEAGENQDGLIHNVPAFHGFASQDPAMRWDFWVRHYAESRIQGEGSEGIIPQSGAPRSIGDKVLYPRASALGGCTAHHALITVYPNDGDWQEIADSTGDRGWSPEAMRAHFRTIEACRYRSIPSASMWSKDHGQCGWLSTEWPDPQLIIDDPDLRTVFVSAAAQVLQRQSHSAPHTRDEADKEWQWLNSTGTLDINALNGVAADQEGLYLVPLSTERGRRSGVRDRILEVAGRHPDRLRIETGATVVSIKLEGETPVQATGVVFHKGQRLYRAAPQSDAGSSDAGSPILVRARHEVILAAGTFNSPQLLMLSGIGPPDHLRSHRINVRVPLRGVGRNLQDRYEISLTSKMKREFSLLYGGTLNADDPDDPHLQQWRDSRKGPYTGTGALMAIVRRSRPALKHPDLFIFGMPFYFGGYYPNYHRDAFKYGHDTFTWAILKAHTSNRSGRVSLKSQDPFEPPAIDFNYFPNGENDSDLKALVEAVRFVRSLNERPSLAHSLIRREIHPGESVQTDTEIAAWIRSAAWGHHACGTCAIGADRDPYAVVDSCGRVRGVAGLRVVDASVFPKIPGYFIALPIYLAAEKISQDILADAAAKHQRECE